MASIRHHPINMAKGVYKELEEKEIKATFI